MGMKKVLVLLAVYAGSLGASCSSGSNDPNTQFAFNLCVAMFMNNPNIAIEGASAYQATASATQQATTACTWCQQFVQGSASNSGGMTNDFYDPYADTYGDLTQINYQSLPAILNDAGVFAFINQGLQQKQAFVTLYVNQCGVRQVPQTTTVTSCARQCVSLAQQYITWLANQSIAASSLPAFQACAVDKGCWNNGEYIFSCLASCTVQQKPFKVTAVPWILSQ